MSADEPMTLSAIDRATWRITVCRLDGRFCGFPGWEYPCHAGTPEHGRTHLVDITVAMHREGLL